MGKDQRIASGERCHGRGGVFPPLTSVFHFLG